MALELELEEGKKIEVPDEKIQEYVKNAEWFNKSLDAVRAKGFESAKSKWEQEKEELVGTYTREIENTKKQISSNASERESAMMERFGSLENTLKEEREARLKAEKDAKLSTVKSDILNALSSVKDPFYKENLTKQSIELYDLESGKFVLKNGEGVDLDGLVGQYKSQYASQFESKQPQGVGLGGADAKIVAAGKREILQGLLDKGTKRTQQETIEMSKLANEIKNETKE